MESPVMLTEAIVKHVIESLREAYSERCWSDRDFQVLEKAVRSRAEEINALVSQMQKWADISEFEYDALCTLLGHLPSVHLCFDNPFMMQMRIPLGELFLTLSDTVNDQGQVEGFEVIPNECPGIQTSEDDDLSLFRKAFEEP